jgi:hypothetical protein
MRAAVFPTNLQFSKTMLAEATHICMSQSVTKCMQAGSDPSSTWVGTLDLSSDAEVYIAALYFAVYTLTTIGYGDLIPQTPAQRVFVSFIMLSGALLYGYIIGAVSALLASASERKHHFYRTIIKLNKLLENRSLPAELRAKLHHYFRCLSKHLWCFF